MQVAEMRRSTPLDSESLVILPRFVAEMMKEGLVGEEKHWKVKGMQETV